MGRHHVRVLHELEETELVGFADLDLQKTSQLAEKFGCKTFSDYKDLLALGLDLTVIAVPTSLHFSTGLDAIKAGSHILVEKPIADTVENAVRLTKAANAAGKKLFVGHIERFSPAIDAAKDVLDSGKCGDILSISCLRIGQVNQRIFDTGIILDLAIHDIDLISYLLGRRATSVYGVAHKKIGNFEDHASIMLRFPEDKTGIIETSWLMPYKVRKLFVTGEKGFLLVDLVTRKIALMEDKFVEEIPCPDEEPLKREHRSAVASIVNGTPPFAGGEESTYTLAAALAAVESYKSNEVVQIQSHIDGG